MTDRYPYRHHGPAVHGSKLADYLISEANMTEDLEQLRAENARLRRRLADCIVWMDTREEAQPGMPRLCDMARAALSADPAPVAGVTVPVGAVEALANYQQGDMDGVLVLVSRQAIEECLPALRAIVGEDGND